MEVCFSYIITDCRTALRRDSRQNRRSRASGLECAQRFWRRHCVRAYSLWVKPADISRLIWQIMSVYLIYFRLPTSDGLPQAERMNPWNVLNHIESSPVRSTRAGNSTRHAE